MLKRYLTDNVSCQIGQTTAQQVTIKMEHGHT